MVTPNENLFKFKVACPGHLFSFKKKTSEKIRKLFEFSKEDSTEKPLINLAPVIQPKEIPSVVQETSSVEGISPVIQKTPMVIQETPPVAEEIPAEPGNVFTNIFGEESKNTEEDIVMDSILEDEEKPEFKHLLGPMPKFDTSLFIDEEYHAKKKLGYAKLTFATVCIIAVVIFGYFQMQLSKNFDLFSSYIGSNVEQTLHSKTDQLINLQTRLNAERHMIIKAHLDNFTYYADEFLKKYNESIATKDEEKLKTLEENLAQLRIKLQSDFDAIKEKVSQPNHITAYREEDASSEEVMNDFNNLLREHFREEKTLLAKKESSIAKAKSKEISEIIALIGNVNFEKIFQKYDLSTMTNESIKDAINEVNGVVKNELSILHQIQSGKIKWLDIIYELENVTIQVDDLYGSGYFEELGGITYTAYNFDSVSQKVSLTGKTKRDDATNFTLIANLIDKLEASPMFKGVEMRSFTKSGSLENGYEATLQLDFSLQTAEDEADSKPAAQIPDELLKETGIPI